MVDVIFSPEVQERFWAKVSKGGPNDCWEWTAATTKGYGRFFTRRVSYQAHRAAYELLKSAIPEGMVHTGGKGSASMKYQAHKLGLKILEVRL